MHGYQTLVLPTSTITANSVPEQCARLAPLYPSRLGKIYTPWFPKKESPTINSFINRFIILRSDLTQKQNKIHKTWFRDVRCGTRPLDDDPSVFIHQMFQSDDDFPMFFMPLEEGETRLYRGARAVRFLSCVYEEMVHAHPLFAELLAEREAGARFIIYDPNSHTIAATTVESIDQTYAELTEFSPALILFTMLMVDQAEWPWRKNKHD